MNEKALEAAMDVGGFGPAFEDSVKAAIAAYLAHAEQDVDLVGVKVKPLTYNEVEQIIVQTECLELSDRGDAIWTRRMACALADTFNARLSAITTAEDKP